MDLPKEKPVSHTLLLFYNGFYKIQCCFHHLRILECSIERNNQFFPSFTGIKLKKKKKKKYVVQRNRKHSINGKRHFYHQEYAHLNLFGCIGISMNESYLKCVWSVDVEWLFFFRFFLFFIFLIHFDILHKMHSQRQQYTKR